ncbi:hypothetical protein [Actinomycetospora sp. TBRC 11914]|uniref:hypothetical protein n=1 Tax=Actinomycetospora sp. TBRC 11914 TaxID=2729387 RepID=UPI00145EB0EF|nr:hypothetical protein [Actinomycetospora sp. TBRC 11914]NMO91821.1 hypothetical protein [Actinomycetospora sp. TBRC 11914]
MNQLALLYRRDEECLGRDRTLLRQVYEELAALRPTWLTCESFELDDDRCLSVFLFDGDLGRSQEELLDLRSYCSSLPERCHGEPRVALMGRADVDRMAVTRVAFWNPYRGTWALPDDAVEVGPIPGPRAAG